MFRQPRPLVSSAVTLVTLPAKEGGAALRCRDSPAWTSRRLRFYNEAWKSIAGTVQATGAAPDPPGAAATVSRRGVARRGRREGGCARPPFAEMGAARGERKEMRGQPRGRWLSELRPQTSQASEPAELVGGAVGASGAGDGMMSADSTLALPM